MDNVLYCAVYELFERMAYYGIASNLVIYLTDKLHQGTVEASNNVTNWSGAVFIMPLLGAYAADAYLGRYWTFVAGSAIYFLVSPSNFTLFLIFLIRPCLDSLKWQKCTILKHFFVIFI
jgi:hypothetical protein